MKSSLRHAKKVSGYLRCTSPLSMPRTRTIVPSRAAQLCSLSLPCCAFVHPKAQITRNIHTSKAGAACANSFSRSRLEAIYACCIELLKRIYAHHVHIQGGPLQSRCLEALAAAVMRQQLGSEGAVSYLSSLSEEGDPKNWSRKVFGIVARCSGVYIPWVWMSRHRRMNRLSAPAVLRRRRALVLRRSRR